ncbi:major facilitator superfamily domain-containing protein [Catenaria anguillulae PL171]|uniref:Major facilitator superfamily domain-containing protein n=1 Tax=Catenaria anguillulae PL171 TaxID=765915 RepID=A0A1Y2HHL8_9FUNG|nr:major facilitator superfamily domain-containing protein [Catenaria anguillulae PL171]
MATVFFALLVDIFSFTIILPLFPRLLEFYRKNEASDPTSLFSLTLAQLESFKALVGATGPRLDVVLFGGAIGSLFSLLQFAVSPFIGALSDKWGRKRVLMVCMVGNLASCALWVVAKPFWVFVLSRVVGGLSEGNVQLSVAMISDITTAETRSRGLLLVVARRPGLNPYSASALFAALLIFAEIIYLQVALPETIHVHRAKQAAASASAASSPVHIQAPTQSAKQQARTHLRTLSALHFAYLFLFSGLEFTLTFFTYDRFAYTNRQQGTLLGFIGLVASLVQGGYTRRRAHKVGEHRVAMQGIASCALGFALLATTQRASAQLWVGATMLAFTSATVVTCLTTLASLQASRGQAMGMFRSWGQLGRAMGPMVACAGYWVYGSKATYLVGSVGLGVVAMWLARVEKRCR